MTAGIPIINAQDILGGAIVKIEWAEWVANYAASTFYDVGAIKDAKFSTEVQDTPIDADNALQDLGSFDTKTLAGLVFKCLQQNLRTRARMMGKPTSDVVVTAKAGSKGTAIMGFGALPAKTYLTLRITMAINTIPGYTEAATDNYILTTILVAKAAPKVKEEREFGKNKVTMQGIELTFFHDSTCPAGSEVWKQTDETSAPA